MKVLFFLFPLIISLHGRKILEVQVKTSSDNDAGMDSSGHVSAEVCDSNLNCCNTGELDTSRNDFNKGYTDVFSGGQIGECNEFEIAESGAALMIVSHTGSDAWKGDWIRLILEAGTYLDCPSGIEMDNFESVTLQCH